MHGELSIFPKREISLFQRDLVPENMILEILSPALP